MALTDLTKASVQGKSKTQIVRSILEHTDPSVAATDVCNELKRLYGEDCARSLVYNLRKEMAETKPSNGKPVNEALPLLSEVQTFFQVRALTREVGGVEKMRAYLDMVEADGAEQG